MADLPGVRQERFSAEETDMLVRAVEDREVMLYGDGRNPPKIVNIRQAWEEIATLVSEAGVPRTSPSATSATTMFVDGVRHIHDSWQCCVKHNMPQRMQRLFEDRTVNYHLTYPNT